MTLCEYFVSIHTKRVINFKSAEPIEPIDIDNGSEVFALYYVLINHNFLKEFLQTLSTLENFKNLFSFE
jgi:hypothetical protein